VELKLSDNQNKILLTKSKEDIRKLINSKSSNKERSYNLKQNHVQMKGEAKLFKKESKDKLESCIDIK
jgi:hypothetical protein